MEKKYCLRLFVIFVCFQSIFCQGAIWHVTETGTGNGSSWSQATGNLQQAINNAQPGDQVWVMQGNYQAETGVSFSIKDGVSVLGGFPLIINPELSQRNPWLYETILEGNQARVLEAIGGITSISDATIIDGFTIKNGYAAAGAGMSIYNCDATFRNLTVKENVSYQGLGAGISIGNSNSTFIQVLIHHNTSILTPGSDGDSAGIRINGGNLKFYNCVIANNHAQGYVGGLWVVTANVWFYNSIIYGNTGDLEFTTFTNQNYNAGTGANFYASNCILEGCRGSDYVLESPQYTVYGTDLGGNQDRDPMFNPDYSLQPISSGINHGNTEAFGLAQNTIQTDFFNGNRIVDVIDIGLSERQDTQSQTLYVRENGTGDGSSWENASGDLQLMMDNQFSGREVWVAQGTYSAPNLYFKPREGVKVYGGFPETGNPGFANRNPELYVSTLTSTHSAIIGNFYPADNRISSATLIDGFTITGNDNPTVFMYGVFDSNSDVSYANLKFTGLHYSAVEIRHSSQSSFTNCQFIDNIAIDTPGVHYPSTVLIINGATPSFTGCEFTGNYSFNGSGMMVMGNSNVLLDGCTFSNNNNTIVSGVGKVLVIDHASATIKNTVFDSNGYNAYDGGIVLVTGTSPNPGAPWLNHLVHVTFDRCVFKNNLNSALWFQGIEGDSITVNNSLFFKNSGSVGGAIRRHSAGDMYITNSTFTQNEAVNYYGGAIYMDDILTGMTEIRNSIIYGNNLMHPDGPEIWIYRQIGFRNCIIRNSGGSTNWNGGIYNDFTYPDMAIDLGGNLDSEPAFMNAGQGDYRLTENSPARNAGDNAVFNGSATPDVSNLLTDLAGTDRILEAIVDIGAFEFDPEMGTPEIAMTNGIAIYPNPATNIISVRSEKSPVMEVSLFDLTGKQIWIGKTGTADVSSLSQGVYLIQVRLENNETYGLKLIKK